MPRPSVGRRLLLTASSDQLNPSIQGRIERCNVGDILSVLRFLLQLGMRRRQVAASWPEHGSDESNDDSASGDDSKLCRNWTPTFFNGSASLSCGGDSQRLCTSCAAPSPSNFSRSVPTQASPTRSPWRHCQATPFPSVTAVVEGQVCQRFSLVRRCIFTPLSGVLRLNAVSTPSLSCEVRLDKYSALPARRRGAVMIWRPPKSPLD